MSARGLRRWCVSSLLGASVLLAWPQRPGNAPRASVPCLGPVPREPTDLWIHGEVRDAVTGAAIEGFRVRLASIDGEGRRLEPVLARRRQELRHPAGLFSEGPLPAGAWVVRIEAAGYSPASAFPVVPAADGGAPIALALVPGGLAVEGSVLAAESLSPLADASLVLYKRAEAHDPFERDLAARDRMAWVRLDEQRTPADGGFAFGCLAPGAYAVFVERAGRASQRASFRLEDAPRREELLLARGCKVTGRVTHRGRPEAGAHVLAQRVLDPDGSSVLVEAWTDGRGRFRLEGMRSGARYRLSAAPQEGSSDRFACSEVEVPCADELEISLP